MVGCCSVVDCIDIGEILVQAETINNKSGRQADTYENTMWNTEHGTRGRKKKKGLYDGELLERGNDVTAERSTGTRIERGI